MCLNELSLFGLYGVGWSHVVTGDVTFLSSVDGVSHPPVAFPRINRKQILQIKNLLWSLMFSRTVQWAKKSYPIFNFISDFQQHLATGSVVNTDIYGMAAGILLQCIINKQGVLHCKLHTIKVGDELKSNGDKTALPSEEAINPDCYRLNQTRGINLSHTHKHSDS